MSETTFARQFLTTLDAKPIKYQPNHVFDPKTFALRIPYTLPKLSHPPHPTPPKSSSPLAAAPGSLPTTPTLTITLKSSRNPSMTLTIPSLNPSTTTVQSLRESVQSHLGGSTVVQLDKIKILHNKKPIPSTKKTVSDALSDSLGMGGPKEGSVEFGVMVMGGAPDPPPQQSQATAVPESVAVVGSEKAADEAAPSGPMEGVETNVNMSVPVQPGESSGKDVLESSEFWDDLQGFLEQRLKDQQEAVKLRGVFERGWRSSISGP